MLYFLKQNRIFRSLLKKDWITLQRIPVKGKHLDSLGFRDKLFIAFSIANTAPFTYFYVRLALHQQNILWELNEMTIYLSLSAFVCF